MSYSHLITQLVTQLFHLNDFGLLADLTITQGATLGVYSTTKCYCYKTYCVTPLFRDGYSLPYAVPLYPLSSPLVRKN